MSMTIEPTHSETFVSPSLQHDTRTRLRGHELAFARAVWLALITFNVVLYTVALPATYDMILHQGLTSQSSDIAQLGLSAPTYAAFRTGLALVGILVSLVAGAFLFWRRSDDWMVLLVSFVIIGIGPGTEFALEALAATQSAWHGPVALQFSTGLIATSLLVFTFPSGRFVPPWTRWAFILFAALVVTSALANITPQTPADPTPAWILNYALGAVAQIYRFRRVASLTERQQFKWIVLGFLIYVPTFTTYSLLYARVLPSLPSAQRVLYALGADLVLFYIPAITLYVTAIFATLHYRLWDIDVFINRTLVYVPLTAMLAGLFAATIALSQKLSVALTGQESNVATVLTTLVVVAAFTPIKDRLQALVDKRFKEAADPTKKLLALSEQVRTRFYAIEVAQGTRRLLEESVAVFEAMGGAAYLEQDGSLKLLHTSGQWNGEAKLSVPLQSVEHGPRLGLLSLGARRNGADYTNHDREALQQIAQVVARAVEQDRRLP